MQYNSYITVIHVQHNTYITVIHVQYNTYITLTVGADTSSQQLQLVRYNSWAPLVMHRFETNKLVMALDKVHMFRRETMRRELLWSLIILQGYCEVIPCVHLSGVRDFLGTRTNVMWNKWEGYTSPVEYHSCTIVSSWCNITVGNSYTRAV